MNIVVCIKQVPDAEAPPTSFKIDPANPTVISAPGVPFIINPLDTYALEEGLKLKERSGGKVTVLSMGPPQAQDVLRKALSLGIDEAVLLSDDAFTGSDTWATAYILASAIKKMGQVDLVICGRSSTDSDTGQVGSQLAEMLKLPLVTYVSKIENIANGKMNVQRLVEAGHEVVESAAPAVITVVKEINTPRMPSLRGIMKARSMPLAVWSIKELGIDSSMVGAAGSATKVVKLAQSQRGGKTEILQGEVLSQVEVLLAKLKEAGLVRGGE